MLQIVPKNPAAIAKKTNIFLMPIRPPKRNITTFTASVDSSIPNNSTYPTTHVQQNASTTTSTETPKMVQQMSVSSFSAKSSSSWYFDSGASNDMTSNGEFLTNKKNILEIS